MKTSKRPVIVALISVVGLWLIVAGGHAGTSQAGLPAPLPTPEDLPADVGILPGAASPNRASVTLQRVWTVTLEPRLSDMLSSTWSVLVENVFYKWPGIPYFLRIPDDAWDVSANTSSGPLEFVNGQASPGPEAWITVTYRTMSQTWSTRAERSGNIIAMNLQVGGPTGQLYYSPLTTTVVYTRQFPVGVPPDQWGYVPLYTPLELQSIEPATTERSDAEGWVRWVTTTNYFTSAVTVREPLFGSDITVTQLLMDPTDFELGHSNRFTVTIKNIGAMTVSRWFYNELYIRPESDPPPQGAYDHNGGLIAFQGDALLRKPGTEGDYRVEYLAPGSDITLFTVITVTNMMTGGTNYRVYAQADTAYYDPLRWAWFGSNPEGYGTAPYTQEQNVATYGPSVFNPKIYGVQVPQSLTGKVPSGKNAVYRVPVSNTGNATDSYTVTLTGGNWPRTSLPSIGPVLNAQIAYLSITVTVPSAAAENTSDVLTITVTSNHDPAKTAQGTITTIAAFSISGRVTDGGNNPISAVIVSAGAAGSATTDVSGYYTITDLIMGTYTLTPTKGNDAFWPITRTVAVPPDVSGQDFTALDIGFRPNPNGYQFENYGGVTPGDYTIDDMRRMFGDTAVCITVTNSVCHPYQTAVAWNTQVNQQMNGGHCDGMASTSLRFFKGLDNPASFQTGASTTHDLRLGNIRRHIAYYFAEQMTDPVRAYKNQVRQNSPSVLLNQLRAAMLSGATDPTTLFVRQAGQGGHAITPYAVEDRGNGIFWVKVYDNNQPDDANRHIVISTTTDTWSYDMGAGLGIWSGDANSHTLGIVPISQYAAQPVCPWCENSSMAMSAITSFGEVWLSGRGHLLITDLQGNRIGFVGSDFVNEILGAYESIFDGGLGHATEPIYTLPITTTHTILLDGQTLTQTETATLSQFGPGYAVSVDDVTLDPSSHDQVKISSDGTQVGYQANAAKTATMTLALDGVDDSYSFQIAGAAIGAGQVVTTSADTNSGQLVFDNSHASGGTYNLHVTRVSAASEQRFTHMGVVISATDTHYAVYGSWSGSTGMTLQIDHGSDGTIDETLVLNNQAWQVYLPLVIRSQ